MSLINSNSRFFPPSGTLIDFYGLQLKKLTAKKLKAKELMAKKLTAKNLTASNLTTNILFVK